MIATPGEFDGRVAVITDAASGIGRALSDRCGRESMRLVLADVNSSDLARAVDELRNAGARGRAPCRRMCRIASR